MRQRQRGLRLRVTATRSRDIFLYIYFYIGRQLPTTMKTWGGKNESAKKLNDRPTERRFWMCVLALWRPPSDWKCQWCHKRRSIATSPTTSPSPSSSQSTSPSSPAEESLMTGTGKRQTKAEIVPVSRQHNTPLKRSSGCRPSIYTAPAASICIPMCMCVPAVCRFVD